MVDNKLVGQVVEQRYRIEAPIGRGAMGAVFRARHVTLGSEVAVKVLHDHLVRDPSMVARFEREAAIAARLRHPNLAGVLDVCETPERRRVMVLELVRGESLASIIERAPLAPERVMNLVGQLLRGLEHAHAAGLVHRDLKPENVIVELDGGGAEVPRIVDFGIAVPCGSCGSGGSGGSRDGSPAGRRITDSGLVLGTPAYMAPEQARGAAPDPRADLFALGVMTYEMLAGVQPFRGSSVEIMMANQAKDPPPIHRRAPGVAVDPLLEAFARRLMARDLRERFASARAALDVLALIERDREAAAAELGLLTELDLADTAPVRLPCAMVAAPPPVRGPLVLPEPPPLAPRPRTSVPPPADPEILAPAPASAPVSPESAPPASASESDASGASPRPHHGASGRAWVGCFVFLAGGLLGLALIAA